MQHQETAILILKYIRKELSDQEAARLQEWLSKAAANRRFFEEVTAEGALSQELEQFNDESIREQEAWERMLSLAITRNETWARPRISVVRRVLPYAAAILLVVTVTLLWRHLSKPGKGPDGTAALQKQTPLATADIGPGSSMAILTLADGQRITLDSMVSGRRFMQGSTAVVASGNQLSYTTGRGGAEKGAVQYNIVSTPLGGQYSITLPDGSKLWLNSGSTARFPVAFTGAERRIELNGEGYFEVTHNESLPFIVRVRGVDIKVLGTTFNISAYPDEGAIRTTLLTGSVQITNAGHRLMLKPGQQAMALDGPAPSLSVATTVNTDQVIAWKNGYFYFENNDVPTIMRQLARWYNVTVTYKGKAPTRLISGKLPRSVSAANALKILEGLNVRVSIDEAGRNIEVQP